MYQRETKTLHRGHRIQLTEQVTEVVSEATLNPGTHIKKNTLTSFKTLLPNLTTKGVAIDEISWRALAKKHTHRRVHSIRERRQKNPMRMRKGQRF